MNQFNPDKPKVSTRHIRKQFGRFSIEGHAAKEHEFNRGTQAEKLSLENAYRAIGGGL